MALGKCGECAGGVSTRAKACPHCGTPLCSLETCTAPAASREEAERIFGDGSFRGQETYCIQHLTETSSDVCVTCGKPFPLGSTVCSHCGTTVCKIEGCTRPAAGGQELASLLGGEQKFFHLIGEEKMPGGLALIKFTKFKVKMSSIEGMCIDCARKHV